jgi:AbiV family abortive infection protein
MNNSTTKKKHTLLNLKKTQYKAGADLALENAENLLKIAKSAHQMGIHGNGTSILITSLEELSKAAYLKIKAQNPHVVIKELENFFKKHKVKHDAIVRLYSKSILNNIKELPEEQQNNAAFVVLGVFIVLVFITAKNGHSIELDLEKIRQQGYYVNFVDSESFWHSPIDFIDSDGFSDLIEIVDHIFENVKKDLFNGNLTDINTKQYIDELSDENVYFRKTYNM